MGSWLSYGLGSENRDLPGFVVLMSGQNNPDGGKSCWGSGFLPTVYQGVELRSAGDPVLFLSDAPGVTRASRRDSLDVLRELNQHRFAGDGRPRDPDPHRGLRARVPDADERAGAGGPDARARRRARALRHRARQGLLREQLPAGATARRARRALRPALPPRLGPPRHRHRRRPGQQPAEAVPRGGPGCGGAREGPRRARPARRDAGGVGRRVRPHPDDRGPQQLEVPRPRPPPAGVHDVAGGRRNQARDGAGRDRRARLQRGRGSRGRARPARDDAAPAGARPHEARRTASWGVRSGSPTSRAT